MRIENLAGDVVERGGELLDTAAVLAGEAAAGASEAISSAAWWSVLALLLSLGAAVGGVVVKARD